MVASLTDHTTNRTSMEDSSEPGETDQEIMERRRKTIDDRMMRLLSARRQVCKMDKPTYAKVVGIKSEQT